MARVVNTPWKFDGEAPSVRLARPRLGEHNDEVIADLKSGDLATRNGEAG
jgi:crotonobetainyl-CoA:carnitine CoA-transferase CaiB-like acyl-CoA transferase